MRSYVIGDIHGCVDELIRLIAQLPLVPSDRLIFLGDYVDRGPDAKAVLDYLIELEQQARYECIFLKGNHEDMFLGYLGLQGSHRDMFLYNGGRATLASYGVVLGGESSSNTLSFIPESHVAFLSKLKMYYSIGDFLCVHAGINPLKGLGEQAFDELLWIRHEFIYNRHLLPYTVIFGHTPQNDVLIDLPYKIGLDTGLVYGNKLSCLELRDKLLFQLGRGEKKVKQRMIKGKWRSASELPTP